MTQMDLLDQGSPFDSIRRTDESGEWTNVCACGCGTKIPNLKANGRPQVFTQGHYSRPKLSPAEVAEKYFWPRVNRRGPDECWPWTGYITVEGYGQISTAPKPGDTGRAHRVAYELTVGPVPDGLVLDHQCHNRDVTCEGGNDCQHRRCVNPAHLEPSTQCDNTLRGKTQPAVYARRTHCKNGHPFNEQNTQVRPDGARHCRPCHADYMRAYNARKKQVNAD